MPLWASDSLTHSNVHSNGRFRQLDSYSSAGVYAVVRKIGYPTHTHALFFIETGKV
jgi:hypothetical protein